MFEKQDCSYTTYRKIINKIKQTQKYMDYTNAINSDAFVVMRHDIEFSIDRAYQMAKVESECDFKSSYFVQITNNAYNALSKKNIELLKAMYDMGHYIGLHYHRNDLLDIEQIKEEISFQTKVLSESLGININRFSLHRPAIEHLKTEIKVENMINTYGEDFFTFTENSSTLDDSKVKYIADSNHQWKYGLPTDEFFDTYPKIQILVHPLSWSENGANHLNCFKEIIEEKREELLETIKGEWKIYYMLEGRL